MKKYNAPELTILKINNCDVITTSEGVETPKTEENDGIWDLDMNN